jgi:AsmA protein
MKKFVLIALGLIVVLIGAAIAIPFVVPTETYRQQLEAQVERATGRALTIDGPLEFSILPQLALAAEDVRFANPPGAAEADMASLEELQVQLKLWPLLRGAVEVDRFVLVEPVVHLEVDQQGRPNWQLGGEEPAAEQTPEQADDEGGGPGVPVTALRLGDIRIVDGTVTYADAASGRTERIEGINLSVSLPDLQSRLAAEGSLAYKGRTIAVDVAVEQPLQLVQGGSSPVALATDSELLDLNFEGTVAAGAAPTAQGSVELAVASIRDLAAWLAEPIAFPGEGLRELRIAGQLEGSPEQVAFTGATIALDDIEAAGEVSANLAGALPKVTGRLDVGALDLNPYLPARSPEPVPDPAAEGGTGAGEGGGARAGADGWSDEPIALPPIGGAEVDFELSVASLAYQELELGRTVLGLALRDNQLTAELKEFAAYGGRGSGSVRIALEDGTPVIREQFALEGLQALPFLTAAADFDRLEGTVRAEIEAETRGATERQLVQNLNGSGNVMFTDGAIVGMNLAAMMRNAANAFLNPEAGETRKTDFAEMGGSFTIEGGVLRNDDMRLQAPALRVEGSGRVNLPRRTINYRLEPKLAKTLQGQGGEREVAGLLVPVIIKGPWDDPAVSPDLSAVARRALEDPEALKEQIEQLGDQGKAIKDALKGVDKKAGRDALIEGLGQALGGQDKPAEGDASGAGEGSAAKEPAKPEEQVQKLLKGLLGN